MKALQKNYSALLSLHSEQEISFTDSNWTKPLRFILPTSIALLGILFFISTLSTERVRMIQPQLAMTTAPKPPVEMEDLEKIYKKMKEEEESDPGSIPNIKSNINKASEGKMESSPGNFSQMPLYFFNDAFFSEFMASSAQVEMSNSLNSSMENMQKKLATDDEKSTAEKNNKQLMDYNKQGDLKNPASSAVETLTARNNPTTIPDPEKTVSPLDKIIQNDDTSPQASETPRQSVLEDSDRSRPLLPPDDYFRSRGAANPGYSLDSIGIGKDEGDGKKANRGGNKRMELLEALHNAGEKKKLVKKHITGTIEFNTENARFDPGSIKVRNFALESYMKDGLKKLLEKWFFDYAPIDQVAYETIKPGRVTVEFNIDKSGKIVYMTIIHPDKQEIYNWAAKTTFKRFEGFGPYPQDDMEINSMVVDLEIYPPSKENPYYIFIIGSAKLSYDYEVWQEEDEAKDEQ